MGTGASSRLRSPAAAAPAAKYLIEPQATKAPPTAFQATAPAEDAQAKLIIGFGEWNEQQESSTVVCDEPPSSSGSDAAPAKEHRLQLEPAERKEIHDVLETSRLIRLRLQGGPRSLSWLAETAEVEEWPPGTTIRGLEAWAEGHRVVLGGSAVVILSSSGPGRGAEVARLQRGDAFGWPAPMYCAVDEESGEDAWERLDPLIVVGSEALKVALLSESEDMFSVPTGRRGSGPGGMPTNGRLPTLTEGRAASRVGRMPTRRNSKNAAGGHHPQVVATLGGESFGTDTLSDRFARLWLVASAPRVGVGEAPVGIPRAHFQAALWTPLLDRLEGLQDEVRRRKSAGYRIHDCFPLQGYQIRELKDHVLHLTSIWYGSRRGGNLSAMYGWFCESMDLLGVTAYSYDKIPKQTSPDGWATVVDGAARSAALKGKGHLDALYVSTGGVAQRQGRSAIDNTVLRNVFLPHEAQEMLVGRFLRKFLCKSIQLRQRCIIKKLSAYLELDLFYLAQTDGVGRGHRMVKNVLSSLTEKELREAGVDPDGVCFKTLCTRGSLLAGYGQLVPEMQKVVWENVRALLKTTGDPDAYRGEPRSDADDYIERFVAWCRDYPGEYFEKSKAIHVQALIGGAWANKIVIIRRSAMEKMTLARYFALPWYRLQPLWGYSSAGPMIVRPSGVKEASHVRANECPYASLHGMSLSAGGFASDTRCGGGKAAQKRYTMLMEMQWVRDPKANIENWYITDIEKIIHEAYHLNPHGGKSMVLQGEIFVNVGQNPKVGSSIKQTQHTQLCRGSVSDYPILQVPPTRPPQPSRALRGATVELVDIQPDGVALENSGFMMRVVAEDPTTPEVLKFLVDLRFHLLSSVGDAESIDFLVTAMSNEQGAFVVVFAPIPQLVKLDDQHPDLATWANPLTGESSDTAGLEETRIDFGKGVGHFLVAKPALKAQLLEAGEDTIKRIWAFNRIPGIRGLVDSFLEEHKLFSEDLE